MRRWWSLIVFLAAQGVRRGLIDTPAQLGDLINSMHLFIYLSIKQKLCGNLTSFHLYGVPELYLLVIWDWYALKMVEERLSLPYINKLRFQFSLSTMSYQVIWKIHAFSWRNHMEKMTTLWPENISFWHEINILSSYFTILMLYCLEILTN